MAYTVMAYIVTAYKIMAHVVTAVTVMACIVMACMDMDLRERRLPILVLNYFWNVSPLEAWRQVFRGDLIVSL